MASRAIFISSLWLFHNSDKICQKEGAMQIMPVSELRNHFTAMEEAVATGGPAFLTKNAT